MGADPRPRTEGFDHMTVVVTDLEEAKRFFGLLGFVERIAVVASGRKSLATWASRTGRPTM